MFACKEKSNKNVTIELKKKKIIVRLVRMDLQLNMLYRYVQNELNGRLVVLYGPNHSRVDP